MKKHLLFIFLFIFCIKLTSSAQELDTVVITAKRDTNAKSHCTFGKAIVIAPHPFIADFTEYNFTKLINGLVPGVQVTNGGGQPGSSAEMAFRGMSSISNNNAPLIVLDGIPYYGDFSSINTNDIYTINTLKDIISTFDFGNRNGNGIINIVTKKGFRNNDIKKRVIEVDAKFGISTQALSDYETLGTKDFYETMYTAMQNAGQSGNVVNYLGGYNAYHINGVGDSLQDEYLIDPATGKLNANAQLKYQDNWRKEMKRVGIRQNYNVASSAANNKGAYYVSVGYLNDKGYVQQTDYNRFSARFNGDYKLAKWLQLGIRTEGAISEQHYAASDYYNNVFLTTQLMAPVYPVYYRNANDEKEQDPLTGTDKYDWGDLARYPNSSIGNRSSSQGLNSIASLYLDNHSNKSNVFLVNPYLNITFLKNFTYSDNFGYNYNKLNGQENYNSNYGQFAGTGGAEGKNTNGINTLSLIQKLIWDKEINNHHLTMTLGNEYFKQHTELSSSFNTATGKSASFSEATMHNLGYFSKFEYAYNEKYLLFAGLRSDGTSLDSNHWGNNWAAGAAYVISEERFMRDIVWIRQLKFKASYGTQGRYFPFYNQQNAPFLYYPPSFGVAQFVSPSSGNQLNIGLESSLFSWSVFFEVNIYNRNSGENVLIPDLSPIIIPPSIANTDLPYRYNNKGIEINLYTYNIKQNHFSWNTSFNFTHNKNTISSMPVGVDSMITANNRMYKKGNSMADFYLVEYAGVDPNNGDALYYTKDANGNEIKTSDYQDATLRNRKNFGSAFPTVYGAVTNNFIFKGFEFSFQVNYSLGGKYYDQVYQDLMGNGGNAYNWSRDILNHWTPENTNTNVPKVDLNDMNSNQISSRFLKSASYVNIANLYLGYSFSDTKIKKAKMKSLRVYVTANNIWMFAASKGMNPQGSFYGTPGYVYLPSRNIMFGVNVGI